MNYWEKTISGLSTRQKIGQMFCARSTNEESPEEKVRLLEKGLIGAIHVGENTPKSEMELYKSASSIPLFFPANMEYGPLSIKGRFTHLPCPLALGALNSEKDAYTWAKISAIEGKSRGVNFVFGPIFDIAMNPASCEVSLRSLGADPQKVAKLGKAIIKGYQSHGMMVSAKHYPGFGASPVDSHIGMVYLNCSRRTLIQRELKPYIESIKKADLKGIMTGHIMVPSIDPKYPASLSKKILKLIRGLGFKGILISDSLAMIGLINYFPEETVYKLAVSNGNDMIISSYRLKTQKSLDLMYRAVEENLISEKQLDGIVRRIFEIKRWVYSFNDSIEFSQEKHIAVGEDMIRRCICVLKKKNYRAELSRKEKHFFVITQENDTYELHEYKDSIVELLKKEFPLMEYQIVREYPSSVELEDIVNKARNYESIIIIACTHVREYTGSSDLTRRFLSVVCGLQDKIKAFVLFGNPYAARELPTLPWIIFPFYQNLQAQKAAVDVLTGKLEPKGKLGIRLVLH